MVEEEVFTDSEVGARKLESVKWSFKGKKVSDEDDEEVDEVVVSACPACQGQRLKQEALNVKIASKNIAEVSDLAATDLKEWVSG